MNQIAPAAPPVQPAGPAAPKVQPGDLIFVQLAREIAMDMHPLEDILKNHEISDARWEEIRINSRFQAYLVTAVTEWHSAMNTGERVRLKALASVEETIPEMHARMHDPRELLPAKVKALEVLGRIGGVGLSGPGQAPAGGGEKFNVTINLGADKQLVINAERPLRPAIDVETPADS